jgi:hypothetical protein
VEEWKLILVDTRSILRPNLDRRLLFLRIRIQRFRREIEVEREKRKSEAYSIYNNPQHRGLKLLYLHKFALSMPVRTQQEDEKRNLTEFI